MCNILQRLDDLKSKCQAKFSERNGSFITFRLPDGSRLQNAFIPDDKPKVIPLNIISQTKTACSCKKGAAK